MILEELNGKKLLRVFEWFDWRSVEQVFEFEGGLSVYIWEGDTQLFTKHTDLLQFLDTKKLSDIFYDDHFYRKRTALEEYSRQVFGKVEETYKKYPNIVSVDCTKCIWKERSHHKQQCRNCWACSEPYNRKRK